MININVEKLKDKKNDLLTFLQQKLQENNVSLEENKIVVKDESLQRKDIKTYLKKFLHKEGLKKDYRILSDKEQIKFIIIEKEEEEEE